MIITVKELDEVFKHIIDRLTYSGIKKLEIDSDYYWVIFSEEREDFTKEQKPCIGSISDDWEELIKHIRNNELTTLDIDRFANVLIAFKEQMNKTGPQFIME